MRADAYGRKIDDANLLTNPSKVSHLEFPRNVDVHPWFPINALANLGAK
jgi:hypothetical protein